MPDVFPEPPLAPGVIVGVARSNHNGVPSWLLHVRITPTSKNLDLDGPPPVTVMMHVQRLMLDDAPALRTTMFYDTEYVTMATPRREARRRLLGVEDTPATHLAWVNPHVTPTPPEGYPIRVA